MSGVQTGTRLERLERLRVEIDQEIAQERRRLVLDSPPLARRFEVYEKPKRKAPSTGDQLMRELGVTANDVKVWAVSVGILDQVRRGRVASHVVDSYAQAHHQPHDEGGGW